MLKKIICVFVLGSIIRDLIDWTHKTYQFPRDFSNGTKFLCDTLILTCKTILLIRYIINLNKTAVEMNKYHFLNLT